MQVKAKLRYLHIAPRKVRLVIDCVRGLDVNVALQRLHFIEKAAAKPVAKLLISAIANAEHNFDLDKANLYIKEIRADEGPKFKRWQPRAFGRAYPILKRTTHIFIVLAEKVPGKKKKSKRQVRSLKRRTATVVPKKSAVSKRLARKTKKATSKGKLPKIWDSTRAASRRHKEHGDKKELEKEKRSGRFKKIFRRKSV